MAELEGLVDWERRSRVRGSQRAMRVSSKPCADLLSRLGNPQRDFKSVHITGSKGKGSTAALVAAGIQEAGYRTGTYGSPHVEVVNERVRIDGNPIGDLYLAKALEDALYVRKKAINEGSPGKDATWFDIMTTAGLYILEVEKVKWAVVEVGMGGLLDSTNVLNAPVVVITNIALEHAEIIGPTVLDIAKEKAGIVTSRAIVLAGMERESAVGRVIEQESRKRGSQDIRFIEPRKNESVYETNTRMARNALDAVSDIDDTISGSKLTLDVVSKALKALPGRMERFWVTRRRREESHIANQDKHDSTAIEVILDGAHVPWSVTRLFESILPLLEQPPIVILAIGKDKDAIGMLKELARYKRKCLIITEVGPESPYMRSAELYKLAKSRVGLNGDLKHCENALQALKVALAIGSKSTVGTQEKGAPIIITGSLHLAGRMRPYLRQRSI